eukprot:gene38418-46691_t
MAPVYPLAALLLCIIFAQLGYADGRSAKRTAGEVSESSKVSGGSRTNSVPTQLSNLTVGILTWNLAEKILRADDCLFLKDFKDCDIVALGIQECEDIRPRRSEGRRSRAWRALHHSIFGKKFVCLGSHKMGGLQLVLYAKKSCNKLIQGIQTIEVACGVGNVLSNKGGICMLVRMKNQRTLAFVNAHLAAHMNEVAARNAAVERITSSIQTRAYKKWKLPVTSSPPKKSQASTRLRDRDTDVDSASALVRFDEMFHQTFFFGDLNYRLDMPRLEIELFCEDFKSPPDMSRGPPGRLTYSPSLLSPLTRPSPLHRLLAQRDQLTQLLRQQPPAVFAGFYEAPISFPPTFKYDKRSSRFDSSAKQRIPAYTDRILYTNPSDHGNQTIDANKADVHVVDYYSLDVRHSDHRPVCGKYTVSL